jgi:GMP synthase-like glutamine amidotransferase
VEAGKSVLGVCLGAQLIAAALGEGVYKNYYHEIGWFPVRVENPHGEMPRPGFEDLAADQPDPEHVFSLFPREVPALHWHGETFSLPPGAQLLARTEACVNQAFSVGDRVLGLQFHLEATAESTAALVDGARGDLEMDGPYVASERDILKPGPLLEESNRYMEAVLKYLESRTLRG